jgi:hypothetical protein
MQPAGLPSQSRGTAVSSYSVQSPGIAELAVDAHRVRLAGNREELSGDDAFDCGPSSDTTFSDETVAVMGRNSGR